RAAVHGAGLVACPAPCRRSACAAQLCEYPPARPLADCRRDGCPASTVHHRQPPDRACLWSGAAGPGHLRTIATSAGPSPAAGPSALAPAYFYSTVTVLQLLNSLACRLAPGPFPTRFLSHPWRVLPTAPIAS